MQAFCLYHPSGTAEEEHFFLKLRNETINHARVLYRSQYLTQADFLEVAEILNRCNLSELKYAKLHLNKIKYQGPKIDELIKNVSEKPEIAFRKKIMIPEVNTDTRGIAYWVGKGKRLLSKKVKEGKITQKTRQRLAAKSKIFRRIEDASTWYDEIYELEEIPNVTEKIQES